MRILLVSQYFYPAWDYGGPVAAVSSIARRLADSGNQVAVLTTSRSSSRLAHFSPVPDEVYLPGVRVFRPRPVAHYRKLSFNPGTLDFCIRHVRDYDVIHIFGLYDLFGAIAYVAARFWSVPYVLEPQKGHRPKALP